MLTGRISYWQSSYYDYKLELSEQLVGCLVLISIFFYVAGVAVTKISAIINVTGVLTATSDSGGIGSSATSSCIFVGATIICGSYINNTFSFLFFFFCNVSAPIITIGATTKDISWVVVYYS